MSVREMVADIQREMRKGEMTADRAADLDVTLSSLLGNVLEEIQAAEADYNVVYIAMLELHQKANRAEIHAQASPEYARMRTARNLEKAVQRMTGSLRHLGRVNSDAMRSQR